MSQTVDDRIVQLTFDNKQFESGVKQSLKTLESLTSSIDDSVKNSASSFSSLQKATDKVNFKNIEDGIDSLNEKFSFTETLARRFKERVSDAILDIGASMAKLPFKGITAALNQIEVGGKRRAQNIAQAKFQLEGLKVPWDEASKSIDYAVKDTAYGFDEAAKACGQLSASGVQLGVDMDKALRGISGVAAMTASSYDEIAQIFTTVAGNGRMMGEQLNQISSRGINAADAIVKYMNGERVGAEEAAERLKYFRDLYNDTKKKTQEPLAEGAEITESIVRTMVSNGVVDFDTFSKAMDEAFGDHAKEANNTFSGAFDNMKAALSRIGQDFAGPIYNNLINPLNTLKDIFNHIHTTIQPAIDGFTELEYVLAAKLNHLLETIDTISVALGGNGIFKDIGGFFKGIAESIGGEDYAILKQFTDLKDANGEQLIKTADAVEKANAAVRYAKTETAKLKAEWDDAGGTFDEAGTYARLLDKAVRDAIDGVSSDTETLAESTETLGDVSADSAQKIKDAVQSVWSSSGLNGNTSDEALKGLGLTEEEAEKVRAVVERMGSTYDEETGRRRTWASDIETVFNELYGTVDSAGEETVESVEETAKQVATLEEGVVRDIIRGVYGNGDERKAALEAAGYDFEVYQGKVNEAYKLAEERGISLDEALQQLNYDIEEQGDVARDSSTDIEALREETMELHHANSEAIEEEPDKTPLENLISAFGNLKDTLLSAGETIGNVFGEIKDSFMSVFGDIDVAQIIDNISKSVLDFVTGLEPSEETLNNIGAAFEGIFGFLRSAGEEFLSFISAIKEGTVVEWFTERIERFKNAILNFDLSKAIEGIKGFFGKLFKSSKDGEQGLTLFDKLSNKFKQLKDTIKNFKISDITKKFGEFFKEFKGSKLVSSTKKVFGDLFKTVTGKSFSEAFKPISNFFDSIRDSSLMKSVSNFFSGIDFLGLGEGLANTFDDIGGRLIQFVTDIKENGFGSAITSVWSDFSSSALAAFDTIKTWFSDTLGWLFGKDKSKGADKNAMSTGLGGFLSDLQKAEPTINSVSRAMGEVNNVLETFDSTGEEAGNNTISVWERIKNVFNVVKGVISNVASVISTVIARIPEGFSNIKGTWIPAITNALSSFWDDFIESLRTIGLGKIADLLSGKMTFGDFAAALMEALGFGDGEKDDEKSGTISEWFKNNIIQPIKDGWNNLTEIFDKFKPVIDTVTEAFSAFSGGDPLGGILKIFSVFAGGKLALSISNFVDGLGDFTPKLVEGFGGIMTSLTGMFDSYNQANRASAIEANTRAVRNIALTLLIFAAAMVLIASVPVEQLDSVTKTIVVLTGCLSALLIAWGAMQVLMNRFGGGAETNSTEGKWSQFLAPIGNGLFQIGKGIKQIGTGIAILGIAAVIVALVYAMKQIADIIVLYNNVFTEENKRGILALIGVFAALMIGLAVLSRAAKGSSMLGVAAVILSLTLALNILVGTIKLFSLLKPEEFESGFNRMTQVLIALGAFLAGTAVILGVFGATGGQIMATSVLLGAVVGSLYGMFLVIELFGHMDTSVMKKGLKGAGIVLTELIVTLAVINKTMHSGAKDILATVVLIGGIVGALFGLYFIIRMFGEAWVKDQNIMLAGMIAVGVVMAALTTMVAVISKSLKVGVKSTAGLLTLVGVVGVLLAVGYTLRMLSDIPWQSLIAPTVALGAVILAISNLVKNVGNSMSAKALFPLIGVAAVLILVTSSLYGLSKIDPKQLLAEMGAISLVFATLSLLVNQVSKITNVKSAVGALFMMGALITLVGGTLYLLSKYSDVDDLKAVAASMTGVVGTLALLMRRLKKYNKDIKQSAGIAIVLGTVLLSLGAALYLISSSGDWKNIAVSAVAMGALIIVVGKMLKALSKYDNDIKKSAGAAILLGTVLLSISGALTILSRFGGDWKQILVSAVAISGILFALKYTLSSLAAFGTGMKKVKAAAIVIGVVLAEITASLAVLSNVGNPMNLIASALAISGVLLALRFSLEYLKSFGTGMKTVKVAAIAIGAVLAEITAALAILANVGDPVALVASAGAIGLVLLGLATSMAVISKFGSLDTGSISALLPMILMLGAVAVALGALVNVPNIDKALPVAASLSAVLLALGGTFAIMALLGHLAGAALTGFAALTAGLVILAGGFVIISKLLVYANNSALVGVAEGLTDFMVQMKEFTDIAASINGVDAAKGIAVVVAACGAFAVGTFFTAIGNWIANATGADMTLVGAQMTAALAAFAPFCTMASTLPLDDATEALGFLVKAVAAFAVVELFTAIGSWVSNFTNVDVSEVGTQMTNTLQGLEGFITEVKKLQEDGLLDSFEDCEKALGFIIKAIGAFSVAEVLTALGTFVSEMLHAENKEALDSAEDVQLIGQKLANTLNGFKDFFQAIKDLQNENLISDFSECDAALGFMLKAIGAFALDEIILSLGNFISTFLESKNNDALEKTDDVQEVGQKLANTLNGFRSFFQTIKDLQDEGLASDFTECDAALSFMLKAIGSFALDEIILSLGNFVTEFLESDSDDALDKTDDIQDVGTKLSNTLNGFRPFFEAIKQLKDDQLLTDFSEGEGALDFIVDAITTFSVSEIITALTSFVTGFLRDGAAADTAELENVEQVTSIGTKLSNTLTGFRPFFETLKQLKDDEILTDFSECDGALDFIVDAIKTFSVAEVISAITEFVSGFLKDGGEATSDMNNVGGITEIGNKLSNLILGLKPFIETVSSIKEDFGGFEDAGAGLDLLVDVVGNMAKIGFFDLLSTFFSGIKKFITGDDETDSMDSFKEDMGKLGEAIAAYALAFDGVDIGELEKTSSIAESLGDMIKGLDLGGGWFKDTTLEAFGKDLNNFGPKLSEFATSVNGITADRMQSAVDGIKVISDFMKTDLTNFDKDVDISNFMSVLRQLVDTNMYGDINYGTGELTSTWVSFAEGLSALATGLAGITVEDINKLPEIFASLNSISTGDEITKLAADGSAFDNLATMMTNFVGVIPDPERITAFSTAITSLAGVGGTFSELATGIDAVNTEKLVSIGEALNGVAAAMSAFSGESIDVSAATEALNSFISGLSGGDSSQASDAGTELVDSFSSSLTADTSGISSQATAMVGALYSALISEENLASMTTAGETLRTNFSDSVASDTTGLETKGGDLVDAVKTGAKGKLSTVYNVGKSVTSGLGSGIGDPGAVSALNSAARRIANGALASMKDALRVNSPSKETIKIGGSFVEGFTKGVSDNTKYSDEAAEGVANGAIDAVDKTLQIHSPSKVMVKKGKNTVKGFVVGLNKNKKYATKKTAALATKTMQSWTNAELAANKKQVQAQIAANNKKLANSKKLSKKQKKALKEQNKVLKNTLAEYNNIQSASRDKLISNEEAWQKKREQTLQRDLTAEEKLARWNTVLNNLAKQGGTATKQYQDTYDKIQSLQREVANAAVQAEEDRINEQKERREVSLREELVAWQKYQKTIAVKTSEAYTNVEKKIKSLNNQIYKALNDAEKAYADNIKELYKDTTKQIDEVWKQYEEDIKSRAKSLASSSGLFDFFEAGSYETSDTLLENLRSQVSGIEDFESNMDDLRTRIQSSFGDIENELERAEMQEMFLDQLEELGPSANENLKNLINMTEDQWNEYISLYKTRYGQAYSEARKDVNISEYNKQVEDIIKDSNEQLKEYANNWKETLEDLGVKTFDSTIEIAGYATDGLIQGLKEGEDDLLKCVTDICATVMNRAREEYGIASPSKKFMAMGHYLDLGLAEGLEQYKNRVTKTATSVGEDSIQAMMDAINTASFVADSDYDFNPVITPVLDDSLIEEGMGYIQNLLNGHAVMQMDPNLNTTVFGSMSQAQIQNELMSDALNRIAQMVQDNGGSVVQNNEFNITGNNPREIADEVSRILNKQVQQKERTWA